MTREEFIEKMAQKGKISQAQLGKMEARKVAKEKFAKDKAKMSKTELLSLLETLTS